MTHPLMEAVGHVGSPNGGIIVVHVLAPLVPTPLWSFRKQQRLSLFEFTRKHGTIALLVFLSPTSVWRCCSTRQ